MINTFDMYKVIFLNSIKITIIVSFNFKTVVIKKQGLINNKNQYFLLRIFKKFMYKLF